MVARKVSSIWNRKRDLLYLLFFVIHIPIMLGILPSISPVSYSAGFIVASIFLIPSLSPSHTPSATLRRLAT